MLEIELDMTVEEPNSVTMCVDDGDEVAFGIAEAITIKDHNILDNRDLPDQHPISAITGLAEALAQSGKIDTVKRNGVTLPVVDKAVDVEVPTKTSDLTNDSGFITIHDIPTPEAELFPVQITETHVNGVDIDVVVDKSIGEILQAVQAGKYPILVGNYEGMIFSAPINSIQTLEDSPTSPVMYFISFWAIGESAHKSVIGVRLWGGVTSKNGFLEAKDPYISEVTSNMVTTALGYTPYQKPASGIPKTDLAQSVQTSLNKADTAIQRINYDLGEVTLNDGMFQITQAQYDAINALWNTGELSSISLTLDGEKIYAIRQGLQTLEEMEFKTFTSATILNGEFGIATIGISSMLIGGFLWQKEWLPEELDYRIDRRIVTYNYQGAVLPRFEIWENQGQYTITERATDLLDIAMGFQVGSWGQGEPRYAIGFIYGSTSAELQKPFFLYSAIRDGLNYEFKWFSFGADGALEILTQTAGSNDAHPSGTITTYNQTRAITNAEIDAICI